MFEPGQKVEYAAHSFNFQEDGTFVAVGEELWCPATVIAVFDHPPLHGEEHRWVNPDAENHPLKTGTIDTVARLQPADGAPPFDLNVKLVREVAQ